MKSYRVFLWPRPHGLWDVVALGQKFTAHESRNEAPDWRTALEREEFFWMGAEFAPTSDPADLLQTLEAVLPAPHAVHVLAAPHAPETLNPLAIGGKKLLVISPESGLKEYALIEKFFQEAPLSVSEIRSRVFKSICAWDDRELEARFRRWGDLPIYRLAFAPHPERHARILEKSKRPQKLLLHVCCGPDAAGVVGQLKSEFDLSCFWYDPNIQPRQEYDKRLAAFVKVMEIEKIPYFVGEYDVQAFLERIRGLEHTPEQGAKCSKCYDMRLERAALEARDKDFDLYATTLAISPHKVQEKLIAFGELNEKRYGVPYFHRNFMKDDGFVDSVAYTRDHGIFRQDYCGCWFSLHEGGPAAKWLGGELGLTPQSERAPPEASDALFAAYETRLVAAPESGYSGG